MKLEVALHVPQPILIAPNSHGRPLRVLCDDEFIRQSLDPSMFDTTIKDRSQAELLWLAHSLFKGMYAQCSSDRR